MTKAETIKQLEDRLASHDREIQRLKTQRDFYRAELHVIAEMFPAGILGHAASEAAINALNHKF